MLVIRPQTYCIEAHRVEGMANISHKRKVNINTRKYTWSDLAERAMHRPGHSRTDRRIIGERSDASPQNTSQCSDSGMHPLASQLSVSRAHELSFRQFSRRSFRRRSPSATSLGTMQG